MAKNKLFLVLFSLLFAVPSAVFATKPQKADKKTAAPEPVTGLAVQDMPYDQGGVALLTWDAPKTADNAPASYRIFVSTVNGSAWVKADEFPAGKYLAGDMELPFWAWRGHTGYAARVDVAGTINGFNDGMPAYFRVEGVNGPAVSDSVVVTGTTASNWFRFDRLNNLILLIVVVAVFFIAVFHAKRKGLFIRRIAGLDAIDEAIGRATEMGKPIFYVPGIGSMSQISTIASTFILGEVSKKVALYDSFIKVPHYDPIVMTVCKEVVKQSYLEAGRPDSYREDVNQFVSADQFSYAASVDGMISREKPAAIFFMGYFMAESLLLAEVGAASGAIQIAGTDIEYQLPFFFTACDYTLIGEELYAAGAYLSKEPMLLSALKVQDFGKLVVMLGISIGLLLVLLGHWQHWPRLVQIAIDIFKAN
jgi:hypothetical protein